MTQPASAAGGFVAGTKVRTLYGSKLIEEIQVGDLVPAIHDSEQDEYDLKPMVNHFMFENKPIWYVSFYDITEQVIWSGSPADWFEVDSPLFVTPDHPFLVVGRCVGGEGHLQGSDLKRGTPDNYVPYPTPIWKRVDQLVSNDVLFNPISSDLYAVALVKPVYQYDPEQPQLAWVHGYDQEKMGLGPENDQTDGMLFDLSQHSNGYFSPIETGIAYPIEDYYDPDERFTPYHATVYSIEVEDYRTYMVGGSGILVHQGHLVSAS